MKLGADKMGNLLQNSSASLINGSINYWSILKIMRLLISTYKKKEEAVTSIYCLRISCTYIVATKIKSLMTTEYGLKVINRKLERRKKTQKLPMSIPRYSTSIVKSMEIETIRYQDPLCCPRGQKKKRENIKSYLKHLLIY